MKKEIKITKWTDIGCSYHIMESELGPHGKEYTTYRRNNNEDYLVKRTFKIEEEEEIISKWSPKNPKYAAPRLFCDINVDLSYVSVILFI